ncbi:MAG: phosphoribosylformylglycinamidine cyclo-ligase [bacterium]|nr:phosphoribosylformylglycinamidine cyclo-ligase [bacterium]
MKYKDAGVNIEHGKRVKDSLLTHVKATWGKHVLSEAGAFGGLFEVDPEISSPVLVSSIDGVGTKLIVAQMAGRYDTVGHDLVNHCVNDILVQGARPLFFLDYIAAGAVTEEMAGSVVRGIAEACKANGCALIGGETAEMPDLYRKNDFDLAGCIVGVVSKDAIIDGSAIVPGDRVFALPSSGLHTNGYSLARKVFFDELGFELSQFVDELGCTVAEELLKVHVSYLQAVKELGERVTVKGLAHITGGGMVDNIPRILPANCDAHIERDRRSAPPVFEFMQKKAAIPEKEMYQVFNMGLGMIVIVGEDDAAGLRNETDPDLIHVGEIVAGKRTFIFS